MARTDKGVGLGDVGEAADDEAGKDVVVTTRIRQPKKAKGKKAKAKPKPEDAAIRELELFAEAEEGAEISVERVAPREYMGHPVQLAICGTLPAGTTRVHEAIKRRWGGGTYEVAVRRADGEVFRPKPIKVAGRPLPIDPEEAEDELAAAAAAAGPLASLNLGWVWVQSLQQNVWTGPGVNPTSPEPLAPGTNYSHAPPAELEELRRERDELRRKQELRELEDRLRGELGAGQGGRGGAASLEQIINAGLEQQKLAIEREKIAAEDRRAREDAARQDERAARDRQFEFMTKMQETLMKGLTERSSPLKDLRELGRTFGSIKGLLVDDSEAAQVERVIESGGKVLTTAIAEFKAKGANPPADDDEAAAAGRVLEFLVDSYSQKLQPRDVVLQLAGFCRGQRINAREVLGQLSQVKPEDLLPAIGSAVEAATDEGQRAALAAAKAGLETPDGRAWLEATLMVMRTAVS